MDRKLALKLIFIGSTLTILGASCSLRRSSEQPAALPSQNPVAEQPTNNASNIPSANTQTPTPQVASVYTTPLQVGSEVIFVEVAVSEQAQEQGLSYRDSLQDNQGMLFDLRPTDDTRPGFWMKDMKFDLDMIWINEGKIIAINNNVPKPAPGQQQKDLPIYFPPSTVDMVLEMNAGWAASHSVKVGDAVSF